MKTSSSRRLAVACLTSLVLSPLLMLQAAPTPPDDEDKTKDIVVLSPFTVAPSGGFGATVGGAQDSNYFRDIVKRGQFPHPNTLTAEGLFSEYDLPLVCRTESKDLFILTGEAIKASLVTKPEVEFLGQIGLSSGLDPATWHREPLNLVAVIDTSGSMSGEPLDLVKKCLHKVHSQLGPDDRLSIVLYGDRSHVHLAPTEITRANRKAIDGAIDAIMSSGSTNMEEGLLVGFDLARRSATDFKGRTRVMQFTDERPNVGDTSARGFMGIMEAGARDGIGQTTIGVGVQFGAELAAKISTVHGGNLFFFADEDEMARTFTEELDMMVTELAQDLDVAIRPAPGLRLVGVYGIPGEMLQWEGERGVRFHVNSVFLSKRKGAIYAAFAREIEDLPTRSYVDGEPLASIRLSYREFGADGERTAKLDLPLLAARKAGAGLTRGRLLVSEYLGLKAALTAHIVENNQEKAFGVLESLAQELRNARDSSLRKERRLVAQLHKSIAVLAGRGEPVADEDVIGGEEVGYSGYSLLR